MKKLSEIHEAQAAELANLAKQHGFKMNEEEGSEGLMADFTIKVVRKGADEAEISLMANDNVVASSTQNIQNMVTMYEAIFDTAQEIIEKGGR